jgi:hypothetical protein
MAVSAAGTHQFGIKKKLKFELFYCVEYQDDGLVWRLGMYYGKWVRIFRRICYSHLQVRVLHDTTLLYLPEESVIKSV